MRPVSAACERGKNKPVSTTTGQECCPPSPSFVSTRRPDGHRTDRRRPDSWPLYLPTRCGLTSAEPAPHRTAPHRIAPYRNAPHLDISPHRTENGAPEERDAPAAPGHLRFAAVAIARSPWEPTTITVWYFPRPQPRRTQERRLKTMRLIMTSLLNGGDAMGRLGHSGHAEGHDREFVTISLPRMVAWSYGEK